MLLFQQNYCNTLVYTIKVTYAYASSTHSRVCGGEGVVISSKPTTTACTKKKISKRREAVKQIKPAE